MAIVLSVGCYQQPAADKLQYDVDAVQTIRQQVKAIDWD